MNKVSIIGAGMVGSTAARNIAQMDFVDEVVLVDIKPGFAEGKAIDIAQAGWLMGYETKVIGSTGDYSNVKDSQVIVITSGVPRKPGMTREELVGINSSIMLDIVTKCHEQAPHAVYVVVSNPVDTLSLYVANILSKKFERKDAYKAVIGFGGMLDSARLAYYIMVADEIFNGSKHPITAYMNGYVIGGHGDTTMVPVTQNMVVETNDGDIPINQVLTDEQIEEAIQNTMKGGATLTGLLGTSAWEAPAAGIAVLVRDIVTNQDEEHPCSIFNPDKNIYIGQTGTIDKTGCRMTWVDKTSKTVKNKIEAAAAAIAKVNEALPKVE